MRYLILAAALSSLALTAFASPASALVPLGMYVEQHANDPYVPDTASTEPSAPAVTKGTRHATPAPSAPSGIRIDLSADTAGCPMQFSDAEVIRAVSHRCSDGTYIGFVRTMNSDRSITARLVRTSDPGLTRPVTARRSQASYAYRPTAPVFEERQRGDMVLPEDQVPPGAREDWTQVDCVSGYCLWRPGASTLAQLEHSRRPNASCRDVPRDVNYVLAQPTAAGGAEVCTRGADPSKAQVGVGILGMLFAGYVAHENGGYYGSVNGPSWNGNYSMGRPGDQPSRGGQPRY